jgi:hypothetical protein
LDDDILINILGLDVVVVGFGCRDGLGDCGLRCHVVINVVGLDVGLDVDGLDVVGFKL